MKRLKLTDGTSWPRPALESDDEYGLGHKLRYGEPTREDLLAAASVISAYGYLVVDMTQKDRNAVCSEIKAHLRATPESETSRD